jgi:ERCC4-type nuclease
VIAEINYCVHEEDGGVIDDLRTMKAIKDGKVHVNKRGGKEATGIVYDYVADYIVTQGDGTAWGVERKTVADLYHSIISKSNDEESHIDNQLRRLREKYGERAILCVEMKEPPRVMIERLFKKIGFYKGRAIIYRSVYTKVSHVSIGGMRIVIAYDTRDIAKILVQIAGGDFRC